MVGDAGSVAEAVAVITEHVPDVVLLDVHMPDGGGVEVISRIAAEQPTPVGIRDGPTRPRGPPSFA